MGDFISHATRLERHRCESCGEAVWPWMLRIDRNGVLSCPACSRRARTARQLKIGASLLAVVILVWVGVIRVPGMWLPIQLAGVVRFLSLGLALYVVLKRLSRVGGPASTVQRLSELVSRGDWTQAESMFDRQGIRSSFSDPGGNYDDASMEDVRDLAIWSLAGLRVVSISSASAIADAPVMLRDPSVGTITSSLQYQMTETASGDWQVVSVLNADELLPLLIQSFGRTPPG